MARITDTGLSISPGDRFALGADPDGHPAVVIKQHAFTDEPPVHLVFGAPGFDNEVRALELAGALVRLADRLVVRTGKAAS